MQILKAILVLQNTTLSILRLVHCTFFLLNFSFIMAQMVKNLPARQETGIRSLDQEDPLEKGMATHSSILVWRIPCTQEPEGLQFMGSQSRT